MGEYFRVREVPQAGKVIGHGVAGSCYVRDFMAVAVVPSVETVQTADVGGGGG